MEVLIFEKYQKTSGFYTVLKPLREPGRASGRLTGWQAGVRRARPRWRSLFSKNIKKPLVFILFWSLRGNLS